MAKSSIHIKGVKPNSEIHNKRLKEYNYVRKDLTPLNESWESESISDARKRINRTYRKVTGKKIQKNAVTLKEGVVLLNSDNTMEDLHALSEKLYETFKIKTIQIHIHRDEGHAKSKTWKQNLHAHMVFDWTDEQGKTLKLGMYDMVEFQNIVADTLRMERGQKSDKKHLDALAYKVQQAEKELEELQQQVAEQKNVIEGLNLDVQKKNGQIQSLSNENREILLRNAEFQREKEKHLKDIKEDKAYLEILKRDIEKKGQEKSKIVGELLLLRQEEEEKKKQKKALEDESNKLQKEIDDKNAQLDNLAGKGEMEDLAARFVEIARDNPYYTGMSWDDARDELHDMIDKKIDKELQQGGNTLRR